MKDHFINFIYDLHSKDIEQELPEYILYKADGKLVTPGYKVIHETDQYKILYNPNIHYAFNVVIISNHPIIKLNSKVIKKILPIILVSEIK